MIDAQGPRVLEGRAQEPGPGPVALGAQTPSIRFSRVSIEQGLSQSTVPRILQDRIGFIWLGTHNGLNRYDGKNFVVYHHDPADPASLSNDFILDLVEDEAGDIWVGTEGGGLNRWRAKDLDSLADCVDP